MSFSREKVVDVAREWLNTPYHHQACLVGVGVDCVGLIRGVYNTLTGLDPVEGEDLRYSPSWAEGDGGELMLKAAIRRMERITEPRIGSVILFKIKNARYVKHCAIVTGNDSMIHAVANRKVEEVTLEPWLGRCAYSFDFPGVV